MVTDEAALTRRSALRGAVGLATVAVAGCASTPPASEDTTDPALCRITVGSTVDDASEYAVAVEVRRAGNVVYEETHRLGQSEMVSLTAEEYDWLGDDEPYRLAVTPETDAESAVYDTDELPREDGCYGYLVTFDEDGVSGGPVV